MHYSIFTKYIQIKKTVYFIIIGSICSIINICGLDDAVSISIKIQNFKKSF